MALLLGYLQYLSPFVLGYWLKLIVIFYFRPYTELRSWVHMYRSF